MSYGLPHQTRLWALQQRRPHRMGMHAMFIDYLLTVLQLQPGDTFTKKSISAEVPMDERTVREILNTELFSHVPTEGDVKTYLFPSTVDANAPSIRKPRKYVMLGGKQFAELTNSLGYFESPLWYTLPRKAFDSGKQYRAEIYHAHIELYPGEHTRTGLALNLGMTSRSTRNLDESARIIVTPNYRKEVIDISDPRLVGDGDKPSTYIHIQAGGTKYAATKKNALMLAGKGVEWYLHTRLANSYDVQLA